LKNQHPELSRYLPPPCGRLLPWLFFCVLAVFLCGCGSSPKPPPSLYPYENLLTVVADSQTYLRADVYRFPYPLDPSGQNAYKSFIVRLANYETLYPDRFTEALAFLRARLYERLGDYEQAIHFYIVTSSMKGELQKEAEKRLITTRRFYDICQNPVRAKTLEEYILSYEKRQSEMLGLINECAGSDTECLARLEKEKTDVDFALFLQNNRYLLREGANRCIRLWQSIIEEHRESKNLQSHRLHLGDFYFSLAKEYASWKPPERIGFDWETFEKFAFEARRLYYAVSREYGYPERLEASGKLEAVLSFIDSVNAKYQ